VPVAVQIGDVVAKTVIVDQRTKGSSASLGVFALPKGTETSVIISNRDTDGYVVADGVQLLRKKK
jgi:predicted RecA/RadA family phage recombinase